MLDCVSPQTQRENRILVETLDHVKCSAMSHECEKNKNLAIYSLNNCLYIPPLQCGENSTAAIQHRA